MTRISVALPPTLTFRPPAAILGELETNDDGSVSIRITDAPPLPGAGDWLSQDSFGNFLRKPDHGGQDERFLFSKSGAYLIASGRGTAPIAAPYFTPIQTW